MNRTPIKQNAKLFDLVFGEIQTKLIDNLPWLDVAFGKAERLVKSFGGRKVYTPNVYCGNEEYEDITPDDGRNHSFFILDDPQEIEMRLGLVNTFNAPFSLVFWFDLRKIETIDERNTESIKAEILRVLNTPLRNGHITITKIYEKAENIFKGYTLDEIDNQFLMHPFAGFRFDGIVNVDDECNL